MMTDMGAEQHLSQEQMSILGANFESIIMHLLLIEAQRKTSH